VLCQRTLSGVAETSGVGLPSGTEVRLALHPAPADSGIRFRRSDLANARDIPARADQVANTRLCTTLAVGDQQVATVEHLLAALAGLGIDNALVEVSAPEVPIMDGSAAPFVDLIRASGITELPVAKRCLRVTREVGVTEGDKSAVFEPFDGFRMSFTIDFEQPVFQGRAASFERDLSHAGFVRDVSEARTFGFVHEVEYLRAGGLARGGSFDNAILVDDYRILNPDGLRSEDEFVRHKALDAIGDLYLLGHNLVGGFRAVKSGHGLNHAAVSKLLATPDAWELVTYPSAAQAPLSFDP